MAAAARTSGVGVVILVLAAAVPVGAALFRVWVNQDAVQMGYALGAEASRRRELLESIEKLEVELAAERSPERLMHLARQLGLAPASPDRILGAPSRGDHGRQ